MPGVLGLGIVSKHLQLFWAYAIAALSQCRCGQVAQPACSTLNSVQFETAKQLCGYTLQCQLHMSTDLMLG